MKTFQSSTSDQPCSKKGTVSRRDFLKIGVAGGVALYLSSGNPRRVYAQALPGGTLDPTTIPQYADPLVKPPAMPSSGNVKRKGSKKAVYYEIAVRQFDQQILPTGMPLTTVWSYGSVNHPESFNYPAYTIEAEADKPVRVKWINELVDSSGQPLPHLLPVDPTLHWANPIGTRDTRPPADPADPYWSNPLLGPDLRYLGPVPMVTHVHGGHTQQESDGYPEAWYLPASAASVDGVNSTTGSFYDIFACTAPAEWGPGYAVFDYENDQAAATLWYHDHTLGMTRLNVYAGPAGFYLIRGGKYDVGGKKLPAPAPGVGDDPFGTYYEIPIVIQDRSFNEDGSLFYPDNRAFFEGLDVSDLDIPFIPDAACAEPSDVSPIWNPEFFGNTMVVNGRTWPYLEVEPRRYRFRLLNGCDSRFLILAMDNGMPLWQIGSDGGFLPVPVQHTNLLMGPAERADVIVDFTDLSEGTMVQLLNLGPDEPFAGGAPDEDFDIADPATTGRVMQFRVVAPASKKNKDKSDPPHKLKLKSQKPLKGCDNVRQVSLNEEGSQTVLVSEDGGKIVLDCDNGEPFGPTAALLGTLTPDGNGEPLLWKDDVTENPALDTIEIWEIYNFTADAHPIHVHVVQFEVVDRQQLITDAEGVAVQPAIPIPNTNRPPEPNEVGYKDTVIAYPGEITRIKAKFDIPGLFVWHCHILEHEDNEMMRPYTIG